MIKSIVNYMINEGTKNTEEDNYIFYTEEIATHFGKSFDEIKEISENILQQLDSRKEVAMCSYENDESFYITFYTDYCN